MTFSKGWHGDRFVLSPDKYLGRDTFVRKGANEFLHIGDSKGNDGKWKKAQDEVCRRVP
jgi:hypothetical protein